MHCFGAGSHKYTELSIRRATGSEFKRGMSGGEDDCVALGS